MDNTPYAPPALLRMAMLRMSSMPIYSGMMKRNFWVLLALGVTC